METIINIVGFGRLYTEYGIVGRKIFNFLVWFHDRTTARAFIVEHEADRAILRRIARKPVYATHGSGLNVADFSANGLIKVKPCAWVISVDFTIVRAAMKY